MSKSHLNNFPPSSQLQELRFYIRVLYDDNPASRRLLHVITRLEIWKATLPDGELNCAIYILQTVHDAESIIAEWIVRAPELVHVIGLSFPL